MAIAGMMVVRQSHILSRQISGGEGIGVEPDPHSIFTFPNNSGVTYPLDPFDLIEDLPINVVANKDVIVYKLTALVLFRIEGVS